MPRLATQGKPAKLGSLGRQGKPGRPAILVIQATQGWPAILAMVPSTAELEPAESRVALEPGLPAQMVQAAERVVRFEPMEQRGQPEVRLAVRFQTDRRP